MKTSIFIISLFTSVLVYAQSKTADETPKYKTLYENEWFLNECQSREGSFSVKADSSNNYEITDNQNSELIPTIKCPKKINYKLASNISLKGLNKIVYQIQSK